MQQQGLDTLFQLIHYATYFLRPYSLDTKTRVVVATHTLQTQASTLSIKQRTLGIYLKC